MLSPVPAEGLAAPPSADTGRYLSQTWLHYLQNGSYCPAEAQIIRIATHIRIAPASPSVIAMAGESGLMFTSTDLHKIVPVSKANGGKPNLYLRENIISNVSLCLTICIRIKLVKETIL